MVFSLCFHSLIFFLLLGFYSLPCTSQLPPVQIINHGKENLIVRCQSNGYCRSEQIVQPNTQYDFDPDLGTGTVVKAWCTMEIAGKWGIFQVYNSGRNDLFCRGYCTWYVSEDGLCESADPSLGCSKHYSWPDLPFGDQVEQISE